MTTSNPLSTGQASHIDASSDDPLELINEARADGADVFRELDSVVDDSFARNVPLDGKYFRGKRYSLYRDSRRHFSPTLDYAGARPAVDLVLRQRRELTAALAAWASARAAIAPADQRDLDEADAARRVGRDHESRHGEHARADAEAADMAASFALIDAEEGERALTEALRGHAFDVHQARQANILVRRRHYLELLREAGAEAAAIRDEEDDLGHFEVDVLLPLIDPGQAVTVQLSPTAADDEGLRPAGGAPHAHTIGVIVSGSRDQPHARQLPRGVEGALKRAMTWGTHVPWPTAWSYTEAGAVPRPLGEEEPAPAARRQRAKRMTAAD